MSNGWFVVLGAVLGGSITVAANVVNAWLTRSTRKMEIGAGRGIRKWDAVYPALISVSRIIVHIRREIRHPTVNDRYPLFSDLIDEIRSYEPVLRLESELRPVAVALGILSGIMFEWGNARVKTYDDQVAWEEESAFLDRLWEALDGTETAMAQAADKLRS